MGNPPGELTAAVTRFEKTVSEVVAAYGGVRPVEQGVGFAPAGALGMTIGQIGCNHAGLGWCCDSHTGACAPVMISR